MDAIVQYMIERRWANDEKAERKKYLFKLAQQSKKQTEVSHKIGGMLIYNQLIEEFLKDISPVLKVVKYVVVKSAPI